MSKAPRRALQVLEFLKIFHKRYGYMPTTEEIKRYFRFKSQTSSVQHLETLENHGYILRTRGKARAIVIVPTED